MKFRPSWRFWSQVFLCLFNLLLFVMSGNIFSFWISIICCAVALFSYKVDHLVFHYQQEQLNKSFEDKKKEEDQSDVDF